ncbi:flavin reductase family protein [Clostridium sp.]|uniref:flavin reductase family protein n=1 Tax=Clostridium sp. TaxID=1506 RepID=UPI003F31C4D1
MKKVDFKGSVVLNPVPVVLITSRNSEGKNNVFTVGWTGTICTKPPMLSISIRPERLSYEYIKEGMEFIVNMPSSKIVKAVDYCGVRSGRTVDKIKEMGFTLKEGTHVNVPYIDECPVAIECKVTQIIPLGTHDMFIAEVVASHINEELMDEKGKIHFEKGDLISYCHGEYFKLPQNSIGSFGYSVAKKKTTLENKKVQTKKPKNTTSTPSKKKKVNKNIKTKSKAKGKKNL